MKKSTAFLVQLGIGLAAFVGSVYVAFAPANSLMQWYNIDDAFYYYKVAQNVLAGHGFSFDGINLSNGFQPLWMVICLGVFTLSRVNLLIPLRVLVIVSGLLNAGSAILVYRLLCRAVRPAAAILGALAWGLLPSIYNITTVHGMEASISVLMILLLLNGAIDYLDRLATHQEKAIHLIILGLIGGLTILARLDNVFLVAFVGIFLVLRINRMPKLFIQDLLFIIFASTASFFFMPEFYQGKINTFSVYPILAIGMVVKLSVFTVAGFYTMPPRLQKRISLRLLAGITGAVLFSAVIGYLLRRAGVFQSFSWRLALTDNFLLTVLILASRVLKKPSKQDETNLSPAGLQHGLLLRFKQLTIDCAAYGGPIAFLIGLYVLQNKLIFGTFAPVSGQIKQWWGTLSNSVYTFQHSRLSIFGIQPGGNINPWFLFLTHLSNFSGWIQQLIGLNDRFWSYAVYLVVIAVILFILLWVLKVSKVIQEGSFTAGMLILLLGCIFQIAFYTGSPYAASRGWYWVSQMILQLILVILFIEGVLLLLEHRNFPQKVSLIFCGILISGVLILHGRYIYHLAPYRVPEEHQADYLQDIRELERITPAGSIIGMTGGGTTAYFLSDRTVVNLDGLINSVEYFSALKAGTAGAFMDALPLDYAYGNPYMLLESEPYGEMFKGKLTKIGEIPGPEHFTLFSYGEE